MSAIGNALIVGGLALAVTWTAAWDGLLSEAFIRLVIFLF
jgi:hypothetical protein